MSPDKRQRRRQRERARPAGDDVGIRIRPSSDDHHEIVYFRRHREDDVSETIPGREFLASCPPKVRATMRAVLIAVATAPPKRYSGGGYWEAMKGDMSGWFEVRVDGPKRYHYRLFCLLDYEASDHDRPLLVVVAGLAKPFKAALSLSDYARVRALGVEYRTRNPRSVS